MDKNMDVGILLKNISDAIENSANTELSDFGLTVAQYRYLEYIQEKPGGVSAKELRTHFAVSQPTVAGIVKRMRAKGYIAAETSKEDERTKDITLTQAGAELVRQAGAHKSSMEGRLLSGLSEKEREQFKALLWKVYDSFYPKGGAGNAE